MDARSRSCCYTCQDDAKENERKQFIISRLESAGEGGAAGGRRKEVVEGVRDASCTGVAHTVTTKDVESRRSLHLHQHGTCVRASSWHCRERLPRQSGGLLALVLVLVLVVQMRTRGWVARTTSSASSANKDRRKLGVWRFAATCQQDAKENERKQFIISRREWVEEQQEEGGGGRGRRELANLAKCFLRPAASCLRPSSPPQRLVWRTEGLCTWHHLGPP